MSDNYISLVSEKLNGTNAKKTAEKLIKFLSEQKIIENKLTDCVLGSPNGYPPGINYRKALRKPELDLSELKINGVQFSIKKQVFDNGGNGLQEVNCPNCGANTIDDGWENSLDNWHNGITNDNVKCKNCGAENSITKFVFKPTWAFGNFGITFWNWSELNQEFIAELEKIVGTNLKKMSGRI